MKDCKTYTFKVPKDYIRKAPFLLDLPEEVAVGMKQIIPLYSIVGYDENDEVVFVMHPFAYSEWSSGEKLLKTRLAYRDGCVNEHQDWKCKFIEKTNIIDLLGGSYLSFAEGVVAIKYIPITFTSSDKYIITIGD